ncbi:hypothetical protein Ancab_008381 [Ancistrocladus abbreviatus]
MRHHLPLATIARGSSGECGGEKTESSVFEPVDPLTVSYTPENNVFVELTPLTRLHQYETVRDGLYVFVVFFFKLLQLLISFWRCLVNGCEGEEAEIMVGIFNKGEGERKESNRGGRRLI